MQQLHPNVHGSHGYDVNHLRGHRAGGCRSNHHHDDGAVVHIE
jgi:hypothetical protein